MNCASSTTPKVASSISMRAVEPEIDRISDAGISTIRDQGLPVFDTRTGVKMRMISGPFPPSRSRFSKDPPSRTTLDSSERSASRLMMERPTTDLSPASMNT